MNKNEVEIIKNLPKALKDFKNIKLEKIVLSEGQTENYLDYTANLEKKILKSFPTINRLLAGGIRPGQVMTIIGDTNIGKTTTTENVNRIQVEEPGQLFLGGGFMLTLGMEVTNIDITEIRAQMHYGYNIYQLESQGKKRSEELIANLKKLEKLYENIVHLTYRMQPDELPMYIMALQKILGKPIKALICDYVGLFRLRGASEPERVMESMIALQEAAVGFNMPVLNFSQRGDTRGGKKIEINMRSGKGSAEVEFSSKIVAGLYESKDGVPIDYPPDILEKIKNEKIQVLEMQIYKKKHGSIGKAKILFDKTSRKMYEVETKPPF